MSYQNHDLDWSRWPYYGLGWPVNTSEPLSTRFDSGEYFWPILHFDKLTTWGLKGFSCNALLASYRFYQSDFLLWETWRMLRKVFKLMLWTLSSDWPTHALIWLVERGSIKASVWKPDWVYVLAIYWELQRVISSLLNWYCKYDSFLMTHNWWVIMMSHR